MGSPHTLHLGVVQVEGELGHGIAPAALRSQQCPRRGKTLDLSGHCQPNQLPTNLWSHGPLTVGQNGTKMALNDLKWAHFGGCVITFADEYFFTGDGGASYISTHWMHIVFSCLNHFWIVGPLHSTPQRSTCCPTPTNPASLTLVTVQGGDQVHLFLWLHSSNAEQLLRKNGAQSHQNGAQGEHRGEQGHRSEQWFLSRLLGTGNLAEGEHLKKKMICSGRWKKGEIGKFGTKRRQDNFLRGV